MVSGANRSPAQPRDRSREGEHHRRRQEGAARPVRGGHAQGAQCSTGHLVLSFIIIEHSILIDLHSLCDSRSCKFLTAPVCGTFFPFRL